MRSRVTIVAALAMLAATLQLAPAAHASAAEAHDEVVTSFDGTPIAITVVRPAGADRAHRVPVILDSHQWAGVRRRGVGDPVVDALLRHGFGVVSIDQRGHGDSGGVSNFFDPAIEGRDDIAVIDRVARLEWVQLDGPGDPHMGAIGASYGGAYQLLTGLEETLRTGRTRLDAVAPEITWYDLPGALAPDGVPRSFWNATLWTNGARRAAPWFDETFAYQASTGQWPNGSAPGIPDLAGFLASHGSRWFEVRGIHLDVPALFRQGINDTLFPLNDAWHNLEGVLTPRARARSAVVGYLGGHTLPLVGNATAADPCTPHDDGLAQTIDFLDRVLRHRGSATDVTGARYALDSFDGTRCIRLGALDQRTSIPVGLVATPTVAGPDIQLPLVQGPVTVAGVPRLKGWLTTAGADARVFVGISIGSTPATAQLVQGNVTPIRRLLPALDEQFAHDLAGIAVDVPAGMTLYLTVSPASPMFAAHASRTPGLITIGDTVVDLPIVRR